MLDHKIIITRSHLPCWEQASPLFWHQDAAGTKARLSEGFHTSSCSGMIMIWIYGRRNCALIQALPTLHSQRYVPHSPFSNCSITI